ncbi:MAG: NAD(P)H-dependent oxidoreductase [Clostridia bacterium]|nr:NAD(P)H-dependent oxidoreductase [Clostridia bacterium]
MANLIAYYSRKGENYWQGSIKNLEKGNTEVAAEFIQKAVGGDLFEIKTVKQYAADYYACIDEAQKELRDNARPELISFPESIEKYDAVFLCFPNWWGTMPMAVFTFLERFDWTGKKIIPICTNEGSGMGSSIKDIQKLCGGAKIDAGKSFTGSKVSNSESQITAWAKSIKI